MAGIATLYALILEWNRVWGKYFFDYNWKAVSHLREINVITSTYIPAHHYTYISAHLHDCGHLMAGGRQKCLLWVAGQLLVDH